MVPQLHQTHLLLFTCQLLSGTMWGEGRKSVAYFTFTSVLAAGQSIDRTSSLETMRPRTRPASSVRGQLSVPQAPHTSVTPECSFKSRWAIEQNVLREHLARFLCCLVLSLPKWEDWMLPPIFCYCCGVLFSPANCTVYDSDLPLCQVL